MWPDTLTPDPGLYVTAFPFKLFITCINDVYTILRNSFVYL